MRSLISVSLFLLIFFLCFLKTMPAAEKNLQVNGETIECVEIYVVPNSVMTFAAVVPDQLPRMATITVRLTSLSAVKLIAAFRSKVRLEVTSLKDEDMDFRMACIARDRSDKVVYSLYLDKFGKAGSVDGRPYEIHGAGEWFQKLVAGIEAASK